MKPQQLIANIPLAQAYAELHHVAMGMLLVQARVIPLFGALPFMNRSLLPMTLAFGVSAGLALLIIPIFPHPLPLPGPVGLVFLFLKEGLIGLILGHVCAVPFWSFGVVGFVIDNQRGASIAATLDPLTGQDSSPLAQLLGLAFIAYFVSLGGLQMLATLIFDSYRMWPPLQFWPKWSPAAANLVLGQLNQMMYVGLLLAAPVMMAMFMTELGMALVSRFVPQLQVFFLAMPVKSGLALFMLLIYATTLFPEGYTHMRDFSTWVMRLDPLLR